MDKGKEIADIVFGERGDKAQLGEGAHRLGVGVEEDVVDLLVGKETKAL